MERALTYVYCLVAATRKPAVKRGIRGLPGLGPVRLIDLTAGRWLVVADAPAVTFSEQAINRKLSDLDWVAPAAVAHERVVESFVASSAVLPMKLFTIFNSDERAQADVGGNRRRIDTILKRVAGHDEWGVRVRLDRAQALASKRRPGRMSKAPARPGLSYLVGKRALRDATVELATSAREAVADLYDRCSAVARSSKRRSASELPLEAGPLLLDAAFLVSRPRAARFRTLVTRQAERLERSGYRITLTGPWPPYSFVQD